MGRIPVVMVVGAVNVDLVVTAPSLPGPGETVVGPGMARFGGGKGANAAVAAARIGARVGLVGAVGADDMGGAALRELGADGVDTSTVAVLPGAATGVALIVVDAAGENQIAVGAGANAAVTPAMVTSVPLARAGCVLVSTEVPIDVVSAAVYGAAAAGVRCVLNPAPVIPGLTDLLDGGPILTPNRSECLQLAAQLGVTVDVDGLDGAGTVPAVLLTAALLLHSRTRAPVVVTLGGDGVLVVASVEQTVLVAPPLVAVRDTTGAGDTFNGVLAARLAAGDDLDAAVRTAVVAASLSVEHLGARAGMPTAAAISAAHR